MVCQTCMPVMGKCCSECKIVDSPTFANYALTDLSDGHFQSEEPRSPVVSLVIDDLLPHSEFITAPPFGRSWDSCVRDLAGDSAWQRSTSNSNKLAPLNLDLWTSLLQHGDQKHFTKEYMKAPLVQGTSRCAADKQGKAPQGMAMKGKRNMNRGRTMMICNIPCRVRDVDVVGAMESLGFGKAFEFVHIPSRPSQPDCNLGYCFVHFFQVVDAERFALAFEGYCFTSKGSNKACTVKVATLQGRHRRMARNWRPQPELRLA